MDTAESGKLMALMKRIREHRPCIVQHLNITALLPHLCSFDLDWSVALKEGAEQFVSSLEKGGIKKFLEALQEEKDHLGHAYILSLLNGTDYAAGWMIEASSKIEKRMRSQMPRMMDINAKALLASLLKNQLVTNSEAELLKSDHKTTMEKNQHLLLNILRSKGPTAHYIFC